MKIPYQPPHGSKVNFKLNSSFVDPEDGFEFKMEGGTEANGIDQSGYIQGTVRAQGTTLENATVRIYLERNKMFLGETTTDGTGKYRFDGLNISEKYFLMAIDPIEKYEFLVSSRRIPVPI